MAGWHTVREFCALIDSEIARLGGEKIAFGPNSGYAQLYSGPPQKEVLRRIIGSPVRNQVRAYKQAMANKAIILDETPIGQYLGTFDGHGVYEYFKQNPLIPDDESSDAADAVMAYTSRKFVASLWGKVATAVCGAAKDRVFYKDEIPTFAETIPELIATLAKAEDIETVNDIPSYKIRTLYKLGDYDPAFRLICLGEIRMARRRAWHTGEVEGYQDYLERQEFYIVERSLTLSGTHKEKRFGYSMSPDDRQAWKEERLRNFVAEQLRRAAIAMTAISTPSTPVSAFAPVIGPVATLH